MAEITARVQAFRRYRFVRAERERFLATADHLAGASPGSISCSAELDSRPGLKLSFARFDEWREFLVSNWPQVVNAEISCSSPDGYTSLECNLHRGEARLHLDAPSLEAFDAKLSTLEEILGGRPLSDDERSRGRGLRRLYYINSPVTLAWIDELVRAVHGNLGSNPSVDARFRHSGKESTEHVFRDIATWRSEMPASWPDMGSVYLWLLSEGRQITFDCDLRRQLLVLETQAPSHAEATALMSSLEARLDLKEAPEDPYKYRRFARFFEIRKWTANTAFARAVRGALDKVFPAPPALVEAYITRGGSAQDLEPFPSLESFLNAVGDEGIDYDGAGVHVEGPRGRALSIELDRVRNRLEVRSSLERKEFNEVADALESEINLRLLKELSADESSASPKGTTADLLAKIVLAVVGLLVSAEFIKEAVPRDRLEIVFPRPGSDGAAIVEGGELRPRWIVRRTQWWDTKDMADVPPATLQLLDSRGAVIVEKTGQQPGTALPLGAGVYQLGITVPSLGKSEHLRLKVESTAPSGPDAAPFDATGLEDARP